MKTTNQLKLLGDVTVGSPLVLTQLLLLQSQSNNADMRHSEMSRGLESEKLM